MPLQEHPIYAVKADFLRVVGHPVRVRILELLAGGERTVGELQAALELDSSGTSQHLAALRRIGVLTARRDRSKVYYHVRDPRVFELLAVTKAIVLANAEHAHALLEGVAADPPSDNSRRAPE